MQLCSRVVWAGAEFNELALVDEFRCSEVESVIRQFVLGSKMVFEVGSSRRASSGHKNATTSNGTFDGSVRAVVLMGGDSRDRIGKFAKFTLREHTCQM
ncbi:MAG: hypothetical protein JW384_01039 [Nitrosomonadaceae bacterium]|nr:hypothetical protein [Nitrosomonadaceae bacterium]